MNKNSTNSEVHINIFKESPKTVMRKCIEHKKLGWELLKAWDDNSKHNLQVNKELIESLFLRIEGALSESYKRYDSLFSFFDNFTLQMKGGLDFKERLPFFKIQKAESSNVSKIQIKKGGQYFLAVESFSDAITAFSRKLNQTAEKIELEVNRKILSDKIRPFENNIKALYVKIDILKKSLAKRASKTTEKLKEFTKNFGRSIEDQAKGRRVKQGVFDSAFEFVNSVQQIDMSLTDFGLLLIALWEQCKVLESRRVESISDSVKRFTEVMNEVFSAETIQEFTKSAESLGELNAGLISENVFEYTRFMRPSERSLIKSRLGLSTGSEEEEPSQNLDHLKRFFMMPSQSSQRKNISYFLLSKWEAFQGKGKRDPKRLFVYLSVDFFYSIYVEERSKDQSENHKFLVSLPIEKCDVFAKREKAEIVLTYTTKGMIWNSKKSVYLKMENDQIEQFINFYQRARLLIDEKELEKEEVKWQSQKSEREVEEANTGGEISKDANGSEQNENEEENQTGCEEENLSTQEENNKGEDQDVEEKKVD